MDVRERSTEHERSIKCLKEVEVQLEKNTVS